MTRYLLGQMLACLFLVSMALDVLASQAPHSDTAPAYTLSRNAYGVPRIVANNDADLAYGLGYSVAEDHLCAALDLMVTVRGDRSRFHGPDGRNNNGIVNLQSDIIQRYVNDAPSVDAWLQAQPAKLKAVLSAYAAGFNEALSRLQSERVDSECLSALWLRPIDHRDLVRLLRQYTMTLGIGRRQMVEAVVAAVPPQGTHGAVRPVLPAPAGAGWSAGLEASNAIALGRAVTANGRGLLLANPHLANFGESRLSLFELKKPGHYEVVGSGFIGMPWPVVGFNQQLAFTGTISRSVRFTLFSLHLDEEDPTAYWVDGERRSMQVREIKVPLSVEDDAEAVHRHLIYETEHGPLIHIAGDLEWSTTRAYALRDSNRANTALLQELALYARADSVNALHAGQAQLLGNPWLHMIAADDGGQVYLGNLGPVPRVTNEMLTRCVPSAHRHRLDELGAYPPDPSALVILDGSRGECAWQSHPDAPRPEIFAADELPSIIRDDYVQNANDSSWLSHGSAPLLGYPLLAQQAHRPVWWRTTVALDWLDQRLAPDVLLTQGGVEGKELWKWFFTFGVAAAEQHLDAMLAVCWDDPTLQSACEVLAAWDRTARVDSPGYVLFERAWLALAHDTALFTPLSAASPRRSQQGLRVSEPAVRDQIKTALQSARDSLTADALPLNASIGAMQFFVGAEGVIAFPGGPESTGIYNRVDTVPWSAGGPAARRVVGGPTHIQVVGFDKDGPTDMTLLTHGQATERSRAPHTDDQPALYPDGGWIRLRGDADRVEHDPIFKVPTAP